MTRILEVDAHVGASLRELREARGLSQQALAEQVDITFQQIQKYENGRNRISASRLFQFSQILGVAVQGFFAGLPSLSTQMDNLQAGADFAGLMAFARSQDGRESLPAFCAIKNAPARRQLLLTIRALEPNDQSVEVSREKRRSRTRPA